MPLSLMRLQGRALASLALALCLGAACRPAPARSGNLPLRYEGTIGAGCAPWDGPAIELSLQAVDNAEHDQVFIHLWRDLPPRPGRILPVGPLDSAGAASVCSPSGECRSATSGSVTFERYREGAEARGRWSLRLEDSTRLEGEFEAGWSSSPATFCG